MIYSTRGQDRQAPNLVTYIMYVVAWCTCGTYGNTYVPLAYMEFPMLLVWFTLPPSAPNHAPYDRQACQAQAEYVSHAPAVFTGKG